MGFFDQIVDLGKMVAKPIFGFVTGGPQGAINATASLNIAKKKPTVLESSGAPMLNLSTPMDNPTNIPVRQNTGGFFSNLGQTALKVSSGIGDFARDIAPLAGMFGATIPSRFTSSGPAITINQSGPEETASSGELLGANLGLGGALLQGGRRFINSPFGSGAIGGGLASLAMPGGNGRPGTMRITRKMKSDVRKIYMMTGMNPQATADILNSMGTFPNFAFDADLVFFILLKRFRNDGPVVTKAAVRKTRQTLRRMKGIVDMYNATCKPTTRRAPMRRAAPKAVQLIKN